MGGKGQVPLADIDVPDFPALRIDEADILAAFPNVVKPRALKRLNPFLRMAESLLDVFVTTGQYTKRGLDMPGHTSGYRYYGSDAARIFALATSLNRYTLNHGRIPDLIEPSTVTEKLLVMKMFGEIPDGPPADKLMNEKFVPRDCVDLITPVRRVWIDRKPALPENDIVPAGDYYLKTNFGAGNNIPVTFPLDEAHRATLLDKVTTWFARRHLHGFWAGEWWYHTISPRIYLEESLASPGKDLVDWKFWVMGGKTQVVQLDLDRSTKHIQQIYDRDFKLTDQELYYQTSPDALARPGRFEDMRHIAETTARNLEFARMDFYLQDNHVYLGEITLCPFGAKKQIRSATLDQSMGRAWDGTNLFPTREDNDLTGHIRLTCP